MNCIFSAHTNRRAESTEVIFIRNLNINKWEKTIKKKG